MRCILYTVATCNLTDLRDETIPIKLVFIMSLCQNKILQKFRLVSDLRQILLVVALNKPI